jgi:hypothetical protein
LDSWDGILYLGLSIGGTLEMTQSKASRRPGGEDWRYCCKAARRSSRHA